MCWLVVIFVGVFFISILLLISIVMCLVKWNISFMLCLMKMMVILCGSCVIILKSLWFFVEGMLVVGLFSNSILG